MMEQYPCIDSKTGKRYKKVPVHAPGTRNGETGKEWHGKLSSKGKHWQYTPQKLDELDAAGEIYWSPTDTPCRMVFCEPDADNSIESLKAIMKRFTAGLDCYGDYASDDNKYEQLRLDTLHKRPFDISSEESLLSQLSFLLDELQVVNM